MLRASVSTRWPAHLMQPTIVTVLALWVTQPLPGTIVVSHDECKAGGLVEGLPYRWSSARSGCWWLLGMVAAV